MTTEKDPFDLHVEEMIEQYEPHEIEAALRARFDVQPIDRTSVEKLDLYLDQWVLTTLLRPYDSEGLVEMQRLCELAQSILEKSTQIADLRLIGGWDAYESLLESKRLQRNDIGLCDYDFARAATTITNLIQPMDIRQSELAAKLGVSIRRINTIVGAMEDRGRLIRYRDRGETWIGKNYNQTAKYHDRVGGM